MDIRSEVDARRQTVQRALEPGTQEAFGQHFTPAITGDLMAGMLDLAALDGTVRILDPGTGVGSLTVSLIHRLRTERPDLSLHVTAVEVDPQLVPHLAQTLAACEAYGRVKTEVITEDFLTSEEPRMRGPFDLVIANPPYGKLARNSDQRKHTALRTIDTPNRYSAFWAESVAALAPGGQIVIIVPRSWANGAYFTAFREWLLSQVGLDNLLVFESRDSVFADSGVLQENVVVSMTKGPQSPTVTMHAALKHGAEVEHRTVPFDVVVRPEDRYKFVRFTDGEVVVPPASSYTLADLGITASTGKVVDFRNRDLLTPTPQPDTVPMIYQAHIRPTGVDHRLSARGKPSWFRIGISAADKLTVPAGTYVLIKRFSSKEEKHRVVAGVWESEAPTAFDNKTNYLHSDGRGLDPALARGLVLWLNSTILDDVFRTFSGHTQVNATDLRILPFPDIDTLVRLAHLAPDTIPGQDDLDRLVDKVLSEADAT
ncbi:N-6 DNA methylase [Nocardiopsis sp. N85]|uniref:Eco57I restriction-modification methylase domain-containing protein n=1 Tax=Nocardiopsis sp. N85 TaxID=3029400 RepID=UPI00237FD5AB|nr:N-6 DNA methylase [Nocardiopsis sp. N85]MDE3721414.1 N-6 DNA methylase [Nocardiopsis sp. N85]